MSNKRLPEPHAAMPGAAPDLQVDYSYDQWRHAQMQHLEWNYSAPRGGGSPLSRRA